MIEQVSGEGYQLFADEDAEQADQGDD